MPTSYLLNSSQVFTSNFSFNLLVDTQCVSTSLFPFTLPDLSTYPTLGAQNLPWPTVFDGVSLVEGNSDGVSFCGTRKFTVLGPTQILSVYQSDQPNEQFVLQTDNINTIGVYTVSVEVGLLFYPNAQG